MNQERINPVEGYQLVAGYMGFILMIIGVIVLLPLLTLFFYPEEIDQAKYFILPGVCTILVGYLLGLLIQGKPKGQLQHNHDTIIVVLGWVLAIVLCAVPFVLTGKYNFTQAVFECSSGWSTTGLTVVDVETAPKIFLIHRTSMLFFGGMGLMIAVLSVLSDSYGMRLYNIEGHADRLMPNLAASARMIMAIYSGYIIAGMLLYVMFGMSWFDAFNHSVAALSTGGFSTHAESIGYYNSPAIELVTVVLMLLGCTNFLAHLYLLRGKFRNFFCYCEVRLMLGVVAFFTPIVMVLLLYQGYTNDAFRAFRDAIFQVSSALSTTGFQTVPTFQNWSSALLTLMIIIQLIGGGTGSTAGGIKQFRIVIILKNVYWSFRDQFSSQRTVRANSIQRPDGEEFLTMQARNEAGTYVVLYVIVLLLGTFVYTCYGYSLQDSLFEFSSALSSVGLSVGITGYNAPSLVLWVGSIGMFIGRLEIYIVFLAAARVFGDAKSGAERYLRKFGKKRR